MTAYLKPLAEQCNALTPEGDVNLDRLQARIRADIEATKGETVVKWLKQIPKDGMERLRAEYIYCTVMYNN